MGRRAAPPREVVGAADRGPPRPRAARHPSPALHTKGPRDPASCSRRRAGPGLWARLHSLPPGRVSGPRGSRGRRPACRGRGGALPAGPRPPPPALAGTRPPPPMPPLTPPSAPARPPGRFRHAKAMASGRLFRLTAAPAPLLAEGKGAGAGGGGGGHSGRSHLFFSSPPPPPPTPSTHPEGFP